MWVSPEGVGMGRGGVWRGELAYETNPTRMKPPFGNGRYTCMDLSRKDDIEDVNLGEDAETSADADTQRYDADDAVRMLMAGLPSSSHSSRL
jgi:hypothetical protein